MSSEYPVFTPDPSNPKQGRWTFPRHPYTGAAGDILSGFMSGELALQVKALRKLASDSFNPENLPTARDQRTFFDAQSCAQLLWKLIKGNVFIKKFPFQSKLVARLYPALNAPSRYDEGLIRSIFAAYWRDMDNFVDLRESIADARIPYVNGSGPREMLLKCAVARNEDEFIAATTDDIQDFMVDLDFTVQNDDGKDMLSYYRRVARAMGEDCQIALVSKKTGSYGPIIHRDAIFDFVESPDTPNVKGAFVYSQRVNAITRTAKRGGFNPELPILILYDLLATGEELHRTADALRACCKERNPSSLPPIFASVAYAYAEKYRIQRFLPHEREVHIANFDAKKYTTLARGAGESNRRLSGVVYLHRGDAHMPGAGSGTRVEPLAQSRGKRPFKKFGISTIDPICNMENKFRVSAIFDKLAATQGG